MDQINQIKSNWVNLNHFQFYVNTVQGGFKTKTTKYQTQNFHHFCKHPLNIHWYMFIVLSLRPTLNKENASQIQCKVLKFCFHQYLKARSIEINKDEYLPHLPRVSTFAGLLNSLENVFYDLLNTSNYFSLGQGQVSISRENLSSIYSQDSVG